LLRNAISRSRSARSARELELFHDRGNGQNVTDVPYRRVADALESGRLAAVDESLDEPAAVVLDLEVEGATARSQQTDAVQTTEIL
jgi:hypothetical protein